MSLRDKFDPDWLSDVADDHEYVDSFGGKAYLWCRILPKPAAAPVLRAARSQLSPPLCGRLSRSIREGLAEEGVKFYDIDTATALALLAWQGQDAELYRMTLDVIQAECAHEWSLTDIPLETWAGLADVFAAMRQASLDDHQEFVELMDTQLADLLPGGHGVNREEIGLVDLWLHMLRIGSAHRDRLLIAVLSVVPMQGNDSFWAKSRSWFLLFLRWAKENNETHLLLNVLSGSNGHDARQWWVTFGAPASDGPAAINQDTACAGLTYREATDLRWALDLWQASGARWPGAPTAPGLRNPLSQLSLLRSSRRFPSA